MDAFVIGFVVLTSGLACPALMGAMDNPYAGFGECWITGMRYGVLPIAGFLASCWIVGWIILKIASMF